VVLPRSQKALGPVGVAADLPHPRAVDDLVLDARERVRPDSVHRPELLADLSRCRVDRADELPRLQRHPGLLRELVGRRLEVDADMVIDDVELLVQVAIGEAIHHRCADCYETFDEPEERERRQDTFFRPDSLAAKLDAAEPDDLVTDGGVDRRRRIAIRGNPVWMDTPAGYEEWIDSLPSTFDLDDGFTETARGGAKFVMLDPKRDPLDRPLTDHRRGLCFDVESTEMREACHEAIAEHLDTEPAVHEVRHQKSECHTDLVYCELDADGVAARREMTTGTAPLHDPLQRFKVWWYVNEYGPKGRQEVVTNGKYANDATNRTHVKWLLEHGYLATTATGMVTAVAPPSIGTFHAVELKLRDWETALEQAARARRCDVDTEVYRHMRPGFYDRYGYADYAWVALDAGAIEPALENLDRFREAGVGLLAIAEGGVVVEHLDAEYRPRRRYTRDRAWVESEVWARLDDAEVETQTDARSNTSAPNQQRLDALGGSDD